jgi:hypothetical protein
MGEISSAFAQAFRDYEVNGVPSAGAHDPVKSEIRALGVLIEDALDDLSGDITGPLYAEAYGQGRAYGDSITNAFGLATQDDSYAKLLGTLLGVPMTLRAVSGGSIMDWGKNAMADQIGQNDFSTILPGYNDVRDNGSDLSKLQSYTLALENYAAWLAIPHANKLFFTDVTTTGTWAAAAAYNNNGDAYHYSDTPGSTIEFDVQGSAVYFGGISISGSGNDLFTMEVDGVNRAYTINRTVGNGGAVSSEHYVGALYTFRGLGDGKHHVKITVVDRCYFAWAAGSAPLGLNRPKVMLGNTLRMNATGAGTPGTPYGNYTEGAQHLYANAAALIAWELASDGLDVIYVDAADYYVPEDGQVLSDNIHPNYAGRDMLYKAFKDAVDMRQRYATLSAAIMGVRDNNRRLLALEQGGTVSGTWTPTLAGFTTAGSNTYTTQLGEYVVLGGRCTAQFRIVMSAKDAAMAGPVVVSLPVASASDSIVAPGIVGRKDGVTLSTGDVGIHVEPIAGMSSAILVRSNVDPNATNLFLQASALASATEISGTVIYRVAS